MEAMTPKQKIAESNKRFKQWKKSVYTNRDDKLMDASEYQRNFLKRKKESK